VVDDWENGVLLEHGDVAGTTDALERLVAEPELREQLGAAGRETAIEMFACENVRKRVHDRCRALVGSQ